MSSDSSESNDIVCKTEFLQATIEELASYIATCEAWLAMQRLVVPDFEDKTILESLTNDVTEYIQGCKILRVHIELLLRFRSHLLFIAEWQYVKSRCRALELAMESLDWRCDTAGVPIIDLA